MSLLWNIVRVLSTENILPIPLNVGFLSFFSPLVTDLLSTTSFRTVEFRVLII